MENETAYAENHFRLPECGFEPPEGMEFKGWAFTPDGEPTPLMIMYVEEDTVLYAVWENLSGLELSVRLPKFDFYFNGDNILYDYTLINRSGSDLSDVRITASYIMPSESHSSEKRNMTDGARNSGSMVYTLDPYESMLWIGTIGTDIMTPSFRAEGVNTNGEIVRSNTVKVNVPLFQDFYAVNFDANGGTGMMYPEIVQKGSDARYYRVPKCKFTAPEGMVFNGWSTDPASQTTCRFVNLEEMKHTTLYATWKVPTGLELSVNLVPDREYYLPGDLVRYNFTLSNNSGMTLTDLKVNATYLYPDGEHVVKCASLDSPGENQGSMVYSMDAYEHMLWLSTVSSDFMTPIFVASGVDAYGNTIYSNEVELDVPLWEDPWIPEELVEDNSLYVIIPDSEEVMYYAQGGPISTAGTLHRGDLIRAVEKAIDPSSGHVYGIIYLSGGRRIWVPIYAVAPVSDECTVLPPTYGLIQTKDQVPVRKDPYNPSDVFGSLSFGDQILITGTITNADGENLYVVYYNDQLGYILKQQAELVDKDEQQIVYLDADGGTVDPEILICPASADISKELPIPEREHFDFMGWERVYGENVVNTTYKAIWKANVRFTITISVDDAWLALYDKNTRARFYDNIVRDYIGYCTFYGMPDLSIEGYEFTGWRIIRCKGPDDQEYRDCSKNFSVGEPLTADIVVTPCYEPTFMITFDMNGWKPQSAIRVRSGATNYTLPVPEYRDGYEFTGWRVTSSQSNDPKARANKNVRAFKPGEPITANLTLQAQYRQTKGYTVTFDAGEGNHIEGLTDQTLTRMTTPEGKMASYPSAESPSSKTYFEGWYTEDGRRVDNDKNYVFKKDTTLYAQWSKSATVTIQ